MRVLGEACGIQPDSGVYFQQMLRSSFRRIFRSRSREAVLLLVRMPLTEVNRPALAAAAKRASVEALLAARFPLVRLCHAVSVLASNASGPGIPEGAARIRALRAALNAAKVEAGLSDGDGAAASGIPDQSLIGCLCARVVPAGGRLSLSSSWVESARASGSGLRILRFRPSGLKGKPRDLSERLFDLLRREALLGLYALTGKGSDSPVREFALFIPDRPPPKKPGEDPEPDFLEGFPVRGRIRTLVGAGSDSLPDLRGFDLTGGSFREYRAVPVSAPDRGDPRLGEYRNAAVLRAEIPDLLTVLRGRAPREVADYLNRVLARLSSCVEAAGGVVDSCSGGGILAFWGAPASSGRDAQSAGRAALTIRRVIGALNRGRTASGLAPLRLFCAVDAGPVLAAEIGGPTHASYTVAGEPLRRSAGIQHLNGVWGTDILVSEYAARLMGTDFHVRALDKLDTGRNGDRVGVYALIGRTGDPSSPRNLEDLRRKLGTG